MMKKITIITILLFLLILITACQQYKEFKTEPAVYEIEKVEEPINKAPQATENGIAKSSERITIQDSTVKPEEKYFTGMIITADGRRYKIKMDDNVIQLRFFDEPDKFKSLDRVKFRIENSEVLDVELIQAREEAKTTIPEHGTEFGSDIVKSGTAIISNLDSGNRYKARDEETNNRLAFYTEEFLGIGDKISYQLTRNGFVVNVKRIS
ncbi:hypothetical protein HY498_05380 [Candidatus Woesearchaeota archaeon]|nr:hypothetical protein [Candidatus Woesearchaeota archaeon]